MSSLRLLLGLCLAGLSFSVSAAEGFKASPDHEVQPGVPQGKVVAMPPWKSRFFPNTIRDWWVYVPAQYQPTSPASLMVFQDGHDYVDLKGNWRVPTVFDNLIHRGEMPVTIAVFINPGHDANKGDEFKTVKWKASNRSYEYDSLGDRYANLVIHEIILHLEGIWTISRMPEHRAICGASSGGICAFTVAWERPDQFGKVLSTIGSFVNLRGGDIYPSLIRKTERLPLRVYLEDTSGDLDNKFGNWPLANQEMHKALRYMGYDVRFDYAEGYGHNSQHGGSVFPDALRWLWRKETHQPAVSTKQDLGGDLSLLKLLIEGERWETVAEGLYRAGGCCSDQEGNFYYSDLNTKQIWKIAVDGKRTKLRDYRASSICIGPAGKVYACAFDEKQLVRFDLTKPDEIEVLSTDVQPLKLVVTRRGHVYFTQYRNKEVSWLDPASGQVKTVDTGIEGPDGITLSPDQGTLAVSDFLGGHAWLFQIAADGSLRGKSPTITLRRPVDPDGEFKFNEPPPRLANCEASHMTSDEQGRYYIVTKLGIQVFDGGGRECGLLPTGLVSQRAGTRILGCTLAGPNREYLYVTLGDRIVRRKVQAQGSFFGSSP